MSRRPGTVVLLGALVLLAGLSLLGTHLLTPGAARTAAAPRPEAYEANRSDLAQISFLLRARADAVADGDLSAFLATVDPAQPVLISQQGDLFANLAELRASDLDYDLYREVQFTPAFVPGDDPTVRPAVLELVSIPHTSNGPIANETIMTFVRRNGDWFVGAESTPPPNASYYGTRVRPWFGQRIKAGRRGTMTVVIDADRAESLHDLATRMRTDLFEAALLLGVRASSRLLIDATENGDPTELSAVTKEEALGVTVPLFGFSGEDERRVGTAIKFNPRDIDWALWTPGLVTHELTHFLLERQGRKAPSWVVEGIAEWMGNYPQSFTDLDLHYSVRDAVLELGALPASDTFHDDPATSYAASHAAAAFLVQQRDLARFVRYMSAYKTGNPDAPDALTPDLLEEFYGLNERDVLEGAQRLVEGTR